MRASHESAPGRTLGQTGKLTFSSPSIAYARKLRAIDRLAIETLCRVEKIIQETPEAILGRQSSVLPTELKDNQAYFLKKIEHARDMLRELSGLLPTDPQTLDLREEVSVELMILFVLIDSYRLERMAESGCTPDEEVRRAIRDKIESLGLDLINMRERLK